MVYTNLLPRTVNTTGASCTGTNGTANRTYVIADTGILADSIMVFVNGTALHEGTSKDFTFLTATITFLNIIDDTDNIRILYMIRTTVTSTSGTLKYSSTLQLCETLGIKKDIPSWDVAGTPTNETVGTGTGSANTFYLDHRYIIAGTYTLYYGTTAATTTTLTETTHYTLDMSTGTITLTEAGIALLSTNNIYAKYSYCSAGYTDDYIESVLLRAEKEVDNRVNSTFTDGTVDNPKYPINIEIQHSRGKFIDKFIAEKKPLININSLLAADITATSTSLTITNGDGVKFPTSGYIVIDSEVMTYTGVSSDTLTGLSRGCLGTIATIHTSGAAINTTIFMVSDTDEGTDETYTIQPWNTSFYVDSNGLFYRYKNADPDTLTRNYVANRIKMIYYYGYDTIPIDITRLTLLLAKRQLMQDKIGSAIIQGMNEFNPEMFNADKDEIENIVNNYIIYPMGNT